MSLLLFLLLLRLLLFLLLPFLALHFRMALFDLALDDLHAPDADATDLDLPIGVALDGSEVSNVAFQRWRVEKTAELVEDLGDSVICITVSLFPW